MNAVASFLCVSPHTCVGICLVYRSQFDSSRSRYGTSFGIFAFPAAVLRGTPYQNNSIVTLEDIGKDGDALLCLTNLTACCRPPYGQSLGNWFFPNGTRVLSSSEEWDLYRTRDQMMIRLNRKRAGVEGIYRCEINDAMYVIQTIYIGAYSANTGEWSLL